MPKKKKWETGHHVVGVGGMKDGPGNVRINYTSYADHIVAPWGQVITIGHQDLITSESLRTDHKTDAGYSQYLHIRDLDNELIPNKRCEAMILALNRNDD